MNQFKNKFNYYLRLQGQFNNKERKELIRDNKSLNKKMKSNAQPFIQRWATRIKENPKKSIFFVVMCGVFTYYRGPQYFMDLYANAEPLNLKLRRWFFGEKNQIFASIQEFHPQSPLSMITQDKLRELFIHSENVLEFGMSRKFLFEIFDALELFKKDEEKKNFYRQSGYYRKRNQKICSVHFAQLLKLFDEALTKINKNNPTTEEQLLSLFVEQYEAKLQQIMEWEKRKHFKRQEFKKLVPEIQEKRQIMIKQFLHDYPYVTQPEIEKQLEPYGLQGLSVKDKLMINHLQLSLYQALLDNYLLKYHKNNPLGNSGVSARDKKLQAKIQKYRAMVQEEERNRKELELIHDTLFKS